MFKHKAKLAKQEHYQTSGLIKELQVLESLILQPQMYRKAENPKDSTSAELNRVWSVIIPMLWRKETVLCTPLDLCKTLHFLDSEPIFSARNLGCLSCKLLPHNPSPDQTGEMCPLGHSCEDRHGHSTAARGLWELTTWWQLVELKNC